MSVDAGSKIVGSTLERLEGLRRTALTNLPVVRVAAFNVLSDVVSGIRKVLDLAKTVESASGLVSTGVKKVCGNWIIVKESDKVALIKHKPLRAVSVNVKESVVSVANDELRIEVEPASIRIRFRGKELIIEPLSVEGINSKVQEIKSIARYMLALIDELTTTLNACRKSLPLTA